MSLQVTTTDSRKHARQLSIDGFVKPSGKVVAHITTDQGKEYFVNDGQCSCPSQNGKCYHRNAVERIAYLLPSCEEVEAEAALSTYDVVAEAMQVAAQAEASMDADAYETLATTKKCACCGHLYQPDKCQPGRCHWDGWYKEVA